MMKLKDYIGKDKKPFIIAEMSGNHNHSLERALEIVELAAKFVALGRRFFRDNDT